MCKYAQIIDNMEKKMFNIFAVLLIFLGFSPNLLATDYVCDLIETPKGFYKQCRMAKVPNMPKSLPVTAILDEVTSPKYQGRFGSCVSFAVGGIVEYLYQDVSLKVSEAEFNILAQTHLREGRCKAESGLFLGHALQLAAEMGYVTEEHLPYTLFSSLIAQKHNVDVNHIPDTASICRLNSISKIKNYNNTMVDMSVSLYLTGDPKQDITSYRIDGLFVIRSQADNIGINDPNIITSIKSLLMQKKPIAAAVDVFSGKDWDTTGIIEMISNREGYKGSHAIALWGYDDNTRTFVFRNSWGTNWGTKGYGHMPYEYAYKYAT